MPKNISLCLTFSQNLSFSLIHLLWCHFLSLDTQVKISRNETPTFFSTRNSILSIGCNQFLHDQKLANRHHHPLGTNAKEITCHYSKSTLIHLIGIFNTNRPRTGTNRYIIHLFCANWCKLECHRCKFRNII